MMGSGETSVVEGQQAQMKWRQQHIQQGEGLNYFSGESDQLIGSMVSPPLEAHQFQGLMTCDDQNLIEILNPGNWKDLGNFGANALGSDFEMNYTVEAISTGKNKEALLPDKLTGRESFKRRKTDKNQSLKAVAEEERKDKKQKGCQEEVRTEQTDTKKTTDNTNCKKEHSTDTSKITGDKKPDYIHVRARRGQATDSHSLAERVRREKISERMKYLENLVPGCDKITGKAGMLDEIINYVQSLQKQVELLSMKLAAVHPRLDNLFTKEMFQSSPTNFSPVGITSDVSTPSNLHHFNLLQLVSSSGLEIGINPSDMAPRRTTNSPVSIPKTLLNSSGINQVQTCPTWDGELQSLYAAMEFQQGRSASFMSPPFIGSVEGSNPRMEI